jgi:phosphoglycolate phosphatase-like HAD superfamily hydrolase
MKHLLLFDIDGTILQLRHGRSKMIFAEILKEVFGKEIDQVRLPDFAGKTDLIILREICTTFSLDYNLILEDVDNIWARMHSVFREYCTQEEVVLLPGVGELIKELSVREDVQLALLTGNFRDNAYLKLDTYGLSGFFPFGAFGCEREIRNELPPIAIERANEHAGGDYFCNTNTIILGDSLRDIECAEVNGIKSVAVATGYNGFEELGTASPDLLFQDFSDVGKVISKLEKLMENGTTYNSN